MVGGDCSARGTVEGGVRRSRAHRWWEDQAALKGQAAQGRRRADRRWAGLHKPAARAAEDRGTELVSGG